MKTLKKETKIDNKFVVDYKRVQDDTAKRMVNDEGWSFCKKTEWKQKVRDIGKTKIQKKVETKQPVIKTDKMSKYQAKKAAMGEPVNKSNETPMSDEARKILENTEAPKTVRKQKKESKKKVN